MVAIAATQNIPCAPIVACLGIGYNVLLGASGYTTCEGRSVLEHSFDLTLSALRRLISKRAYNNESEEYEVFNIVVAPQPELFTGGWCTYGRMVHFD
jgi:hypothetical protein